MTRVPFVIVLVLLSCVTRIGSADDRMATLGPLFVEMWEKISNRATIRFIQRLNEGPFAEAPNELKNRIANAALPILQDELSWEKVGGRVSAVIVEGCDDESLDQMVRYMTREEKGPVPIDEIPADYIGCVTAGMVRSMSIVEDGISKAIPRVEEAIRALAQ